MKTIIKKAALAAAIISAPLAASATDLVGGGASLPALAYVGDNFTVTNPRSRLSTDAGLFAGFDSSFNPYQQTTITSGSIFDAFQIINPSHTASPASLLHALARILQEPDQRHLARLARRALAPHRRRQLGDQRLHRYRVSRICRLHAMRFHAG